MQNLCKKLKKIKFQRYKKFFRSLKEKNLLNFKFLFLGCTMSIGFDLAKELGKKKSI